MKTPWRDIAVSDAHVHFLSDHFFEILTQQKGDSVIDKLPALGIEAPDPEPVHLAERWVRELDQHSVHSACLIASVPGDESSVLCAVRAFPDRFTGYFMLDPTRPGQVERVAASLDAGMRGVCFFPAMHGYAMHDDRVRDVLAEIAGRPGTVAFVHCGVLSVGIRGRLGLPSRFDMRFSNPIDLHGVAMQFPAVPFVIPNFGAGYLREALMLADLCPNVYLDTSSSNAWVKYLSPRVELRDVFRQALDIAGPRRLLFGSDSSFFPRGWHRAVFEAQVQVLFDLGIDADTAELILGGNLRRLLST